MDRNRVLLTFISSYVCFAAIFLIQCDAATRATTTHKYRDGSTKKTTPRKIHLIKKFDLDDTSNSDPYVNSPFSLPPYESLPPFSLPENTPPFCVYPPLTPTPIPPSTAVPSPTDGGYTPLPPPAATTPTLPGPPQTMPFPNPPAPTEPVLSPPYYYEPNPPSSIVPNPPNYNLPSPSSGVIPSPRFLPPIVFPPPTVPPPPRRTPATAMWCVAKASVPDPIILEAMNYACGSGADCDQIQPSGSCFSPNTLFAHASYAFNSYWQRTKVAGGTCDFGGTAILVTVDPSYDGCHFIYF